MRVRLTPQWVVPLALLGLFLAVPAALACNGYGVPAQGLCAPRAAVYAPVQAAPIYAPPVQQFQAYPPLVQQFQRAPVYAPPVRFQAPVYAPPVQFAPPVYVPPVQFAPVKSFAPALGVGRFEQRTTERRGLFGRVRSRSRTTIVGP